MTRFDTPDPISAVISLVAGDVRVIAGDRTDTVVEVRPSDGSNAMDVKAAEQTRVEFSHGRLLLKAPKWRKYSLFGGGGSIDVAIELPTDSRVDGDIAMGDFRSEGRLGECRFKSSTGHIWLGRTGPLQVTTSAGDVTVEEASGHAEITGCGDVRIRALGGSAVIKNLNGSSWVGNVTGDLRCNAANGDISVDRAQATVVAKTANGSVRIGQVERGCVVLETAFGQLEVGIRAGTAALLDVASKFGRVRNSLDASGSPEPTEQTVELRARTSYGDIVIHRA